MPTRFPVLLCLAIVAIGGTSIVDSTEQEFLRANAMVMDRMMRGMSVNSFGNVDSDFVAIMEPHHRGAIEMAELELRYGANEQLRRIAQEIIVDQQQEIVAMRLALGRPLPAGEPVPDQVKPTHTIAGMPGN